jgi:hypothetical protein
MCVTPGVFWIKYKKPLSTPVLTNAPWKAVVELARVLLNFSHKIWHKFLQFANAGKQRKHGIFGSLIYFLLILPLNHSGSWTRFISNKPFRTNHFEQNISNRTFRTEHFEQNISNKTFRTKHFEQNIFEQISPRQFVFNGQEKKVFFLKSPLTFYPYLSCRQTNDNPNASGILLNTMDTF